MSNISTFPDKIDVIPNFLDVTDKDGALIKSFESAMESNDFARANEILIQIENFDNKIITATRLNQLKSCIMALENFYKIDIKPYIENKQNAWTALIGEFKFLGVYSSSMNYNINNIVSFRVDGKYNLYIRTDGDSLANIPPTDTKYWRVLTVEGERGITKNNETAFYFEWKPNQTYKTNSIVSYNNKWWIALNDNIDSEPKEQSINWMMIVKALQASYPIQTGQPYNQNEGEFWFKVIN